MTQERQNQMYIARLHPLQKKHQRLVQKVIDDNNLSVKLQISPNNECKINDYSVGLDFNLEGCWDTETDKAPVKVIFYKILKVMPNNHLEISLVDAKWYDVK